MFFFFINLLIIIIGIILTIGIPRAQPFENYNINYSRSTFAIFFENIPIYCAPIIIVFFFYLNIV